MLRWRIGDVIVTKIVELESGGLQAMFPRATLPEIVGIPWLVPDFASAEGDLLGSVHAFVIETPVRRVVVDTCVGNDKERLLPAINKLQTSFLRDFEAAFRRESIDTVLCTHLHFDHIGRNTMFSGGRWVPTFPNARYLLARDELDFWRAHPGSPDESGAFVDSVQPILDAGLVDLVETDARICDEIRLIPTPGHTKGHVSIAITSRGEQALITGDFVHHPCQLARPEWGTHFDFDVAEAERTRARLFADLADTPTLIIGSHFRSPTAGRIVRDGGAYRLETDVSSGINPRQRF